MTRNRRPEGRQLGRVDDNSNPSGNRTLLRAFAWAVGRPFEVGAALVAGWGAFAIAGAR